MLKGVTRPISAVVLAALVAGTVTIFPGISDQVVASAPMHAGKSDRLDLRPLGNRCSQQAWPYFEAQCVRDPRMALGRARPARIVTADRVNLSR
jgi:hypothetical protein